MECESGDRESFRRHSSLLTFPLNCTRSVTHYIIGDRSWEFFGGIKVIYIITHYIIGDRSCYLGNNYYLFPKNQGMSRSRCKTIDRKEYTMLFK